MHSHSILTPASARIYDFIYGIILPLMFLLSMLFSAHAGLSFLKKYQSQANKAYIQKNQEAQALHPERSLFQNNERYDVLAIRETKNSSDRQAMIRQASSGQVRFYRIGDRLFGKGPFVAAVEKDRVMFWLDGRTRKIPVTP